MGALYAVQIMVVVIYVSSEGKKLYIKNLYLLVDMLFLYICDYPQTQLSWKGRVEKMDVEIKLLSELNQQKSLSANLSVQLC